MAQAVKNLPAMQKTRVQSLGQENNPGEANGYPLRYSCLENPMDRGAWQATNPWGHKKSDMTEQLMHFFLIVNSNLIQRTGKITKNILTYFNARLTRNQSLAIL